MRVPIKWLAEYVDIKGLSPKQISDGLRLSGTENALEETSSFENIIVGEIKSVSKHPNADKLSVAIVSNGKEDLQIVCGAPNIKKGQKVPLALIGAKFGDFEIKKAKIRDVESNGMMCAEDELGLGEDHTGIMILDKKAKVGMRFSDYVGGTGTIIDAELTPNRGDCLSIIGMAREVVATFDKKMKKISFDKPKIISKKKIEVEVKDKDLCPRYIAKVVEGVKIGPSPKWMQERLSSAGVRPISNVVDVTNYVMLEWGQPLHAFDFEKISDAKITNDKKQITKKIIVRRAKDGEKMKTLDGVERKFTKDDLLICDSKKTVAVAGVMGGEDSEVSEKTTTIVLEAAVFESSSIRKTAQRLVKRTEASNRFEKGIPLTLPEVAIERTAQLLTEIASGKAGENTDVLSSWIWLQHIGLRINRIKEILGIDVPEEDIIKILNNLGFKAEKFDFKKEARKHVGKPYVFGASYKTHGDMAFDCSYLSDYLYSLMGKFIGYTSLAQYEIGKLVNESNLQPGDVLFLKGVIDKSVTNHYFIPSINGGYKKIECKEKEVGHNAIYIGDGRIIHARHYDYDYRNKKWKKLPEKNAKVIEEDVGVFTKHPEYLGARRYVDNPNEWITVDVPWWRIDVTREEDLIEEVARIYGYDKLESTIPSGKMPQQIKNKKLDLENKVRSVMVGAGFWETYTYSFVSGKMMQFMGGTENALKISNPLSVDQEYMRKSIIPSLVQVVARNQENYDEVKIFELANIYFPKGKMSEEIPVLSMAVKSKSGKEDAFFELKGAIENLLSNFGLVSFAKEEIENCKKGQAATIKIDGKKVGTIGMINGKYKNLFDIKYEVCVASIGIHEIGDEQETIYKGIPKYPFSVRDINVVLADEIAVNKIIDTSKKANTKNLKEVTILDVYNGKSISEGKKSVTIRLVFGADDRTLTEEEIMGDHDVVLNSLKKLGGELRS